MEVQNGYFVIGAGSKRRAGDFFLFGRGALFQSRDILRLRGLNRPLNLIRKAIPVSPLTPFQYGVCYSSTSFNISIFLLFLKLFTLYKKLQSTYKAEEELIQKALHAYNKKKRV